MNIITLPNTVSNHQIRQRYPVKLPVSLVISNGYYHLSLMRFLVVCMGQHTVINPMVYRMFCSSLAILCLPFHHALDRTDTLLMNMYYYI